MRLAVLSHKPCWRSPASPSGYATDGGFPMQMRAISELFDETRLLVPVGNCEISDGERPLAGRHLSVVELSPPSGQGLVRRVGLIPWLTRNGAAVFREFSRADAIHIPVPGDIGSLGILLAHAMKKRLFVRHCGNWLAPRTRADRWLKSFMTKHAGGLNVMLATGGGNEPPCANPHVHWIFSTTLTRAEVASLGRPRSLCEPRRLRMIIAGRQEQPKGTGRIIQALPAIRRVLPEATLTVAGDGNDLPLFRRMACELRLEGAVRFLGRLNHSQVLEAMQDADLFVFPTSASEGFPKVIHEALACGLPVVAAPVSVLPHVLEGGCGVLLKDHGTDEIVRGVLACAAAESYLRMSSRALETASRFSLETWQQAISESLSTAWGPLRHSVTELTAC